MEKVSRERLLCSCAVAFALAGCSTSATVDAAKAKADAEAAKAEVTQVKSELTQMRSDLAQAQAELRQLKSKGVARYQLFMDAKGGRAYLFDPATGQVLKTELMGGGWSIAANAR